jgi:hypothetical protein
MLMVRMDGFYSLPMMRVRIVASYGIEIGIGIRIGIDPSSFRHDETKMQVCLAYNDNPLLEKEYRKT